MYPQAILGSLAFDTSGRLVLGFVDRASVQGGNRQWGTDTTDTQFYETVSSADMLIAAAPAEAGDDFVLESNGSVGGAAGVGAGNNQGPGGGEFFEDSQGTTDQGPNHFENTEGGVVTYPGVPEAASTAMDPLNAIRVTGLQWFALGDGEKVRGYNHTADPGGGVGREVNLTGGAYFQKGGGIGAVALLTREPPVEIGNRVWLDADFNGRQDADEPAIQGAPVQLFARGADGAPTGAALDETITDGDGEYYFRQRRGRRVRPGRRRGRRQPVRRRLRPWHRSGHASRPERRQRRLRRTYLGRPRLHDANSPGRRRDPARLKRGSGERTGQGRRRTARPQ